MTEPFKSDLSAFILPPGFQKHSNELGQAFVEILKDVFALQCIRDSAILDKEE
jgi:hypothetical protein